MEGRTHTQDKEEETKGFKINVKKRKYMYWSMHNNAMKQAVRLMCLQIVRAY